jgi:hypothetical protein
MGLLVPHGFVSFFEILRRGEEAYGYEPNDPRPDPEGDLLRRLASGSPKSYGSIVARRDGDQVTMATPPVLGEHIPVPPAAWAGGSGDDCLWQPGPPLAAYQGVLAVGDLFVYPLLTQLEGDAWVTSQLPNRAVGGAVDAAAPAASRDEELAAWMRNYAERTTLPKREYAIRDCIAATGCKWRPAKAAWMTLGAGQKRNARQTDRAISKNG